MGNDGYRGDFNTSTSTNGVVRRSDGILCTNTSSSVSQLKYKENITDMGDGMSIINSLRPRNFTWKDEIVNKDFQEDIYDLQQQNQYGFIVEEVEETQPDLVHNNFINGERIPQMWKINAVVAITVKAIQELSSEIEQLKLRIAQLEGGQ